MARSKWSFGRLWSLLSREPRRGAANRSKRPPAGRPGKRPPLTIELLEERWVLSSVATLLMDQADYAPGATAQITASGFAANETVTLSVVHSDTQASADGSNPWTVTAAADGTFATTWFVSPTDSVDAYFTLTATGSTGDAASASFHDSPTPAATYSFANSLNASQNGVAALTTVTSGTVVGTTQYTTDSVFGVNQTVYQFARGSGVSLNVGSILSPTSTYTVEMVVKLDNVTTYGKLIDYKNQGVDRGLYVESGRIQFYNATTIPAGGSLTTSQYYRIVLTRNSNNVITGYIDGTQAFSLTDSNSDGVVDTNNLLKFFVDDTIANGGNETTSGKVALLRVYQGALSATDVVALNATPIVSSLTATPGSISPNDTVTVNGAFSESDTGAAGAHTVVINYGDGASDTVNLAANQPLTFSDSHQYTTAQSGNTPYTVTATVTDSNGASGSGSTTVYVSPVVINTTSLPNGTAGQSYSQTLSAGSTSTPLTYNVAAGSLPPGMSLNSSTGVLSGKPAAGTYNFTVDVMDAARTGNASGLVDLWSGQGNANDDAGSNPGALVNSPNFAAGQVGQAFWLNGQLAQYVRLPNDVFPMPTTGTGTTSFSFQTWFQTTSGGVILGQQGFSPFSGNLNGWVPSIYVDTSGFLRVQMFWPGSTNQVISSTTVNDGTFHFLAVTYNGTTQTVYLDGSSIGSKSFSQQAYAPVYYYQLGTGYTNGWPSGNGGWYSFTGLIDETALYNRALSSSEVQANYDAGNAGSGAIVGLGNIASQNYTLTVNALSGSTTTTLTGGAGGSVPYGTSVTFTATVNSASSPNIAGGLEAFYYNLNGTPTGVASAFNVATGAPTAAATLVTSRTEAQINVPDTTSGFLPTVSGLQTGNVAAEWSGLIQITTGGAYTFYSPSDDATMLYIDGIRVVSNDAQHGMFDGLSAPLTLSAGLHTFLEMYEQGGGAAGVEVDYQGPDTNNLRTIIPAGVLFHGPTGLMTFKDNGTTVATALVTTSASDVTSAVFTTTTLSVGSHSITASYAGSGDFNASSATTTVTQTITKANTNLASSSVPTAVSGQSVQLTGVVTNTSALVSGLTASYYNLSAGPGSVNVAFNLPTGTPNIYANLVATRTDAQINVPNSGNGFVPTTVVPGLNTANVAAEWAGLIQITSAGTYTFYSPSDDGTLLYIDGTLVVSNDGQHGFVDGSSAPINLSAGYHTLLELYEQGGGGGGVRVDYQGPDTNNVRTTVPAGVLFHSGGTATGTVTGTLNGTTSLGTATVNTVNGFSTDVGSVSNLPVGNDSITGSYSGDSNNNPSTSSPSTVLIFNPTFTTGVGSSLNPADSGESVTFTAAVVSSAAPGLTASYYNLGVAPTSVSTAFTVPGGAPTVNATFVATRTDAQINVPNNYNGFQPTTAVSGLNATNVAAEWSGLIQITTTGTYTFTTASDDGSLLYIDGNLVCSNDGTHLIGNGTSTPMTLSAGDHTLLELYEQGNGYAGLLVSYKGPDTGGVQEIIPASVLFHATASPTGTVTFNDGSTSLGSGSLSTTNGVTTATITTATLSVGSHPITATYNAVASAVLTETVNALPAISTTSLPAATAGLAYTATVVTTGGTTPLTFSVSAGSLPAGLSLNSATGVISGTPTVLGTFIFTIRVADATGATASQPYAIAVGSPTYFWDPSHTHTGTGSGGAGTWDTSTANWFNGTADVVWTNAYDPVAVFDGGASGTVTVSAGVTASAIKFSGSGYVIQNNTITLAGGTGSVSVALGGSDTISSVLAGSTGLTLVGGGTLALTAANTYTTGTTISAGTILIGNAAALGSGSVTLNDANTGSGNTALLATISALVGTNPIANNITVANFGSGTSMLGTTTDPTVATAFTGNISLQKNVTLQGGNSDRTSYDGVISSSGSVTINVTSANAAGERTSFGPDLNPVNTFTGTINIVGNNTRFQAGPAASTIPSAVSVIVGAGASFRIDATALAIDGLSGSGTVTNVVFTSTTLTVGSNNGTATFSGVIQDGSGSISLVKAGTGTETLTGANTYTGSTTISAGTLQVGNGALTGTLGTGSVVDNATLTYNRSDSFTVANNISGTGGLTVAGVGTLTLTGNNSYSGTTTINAGTTLQAGSATALSAGSAVSDAGTLNLGGFSNSIGDLNGAGTVTNTIGTIYQIGNGSLVNGNINGFNNSLTGESEDSWVGNVFTATSGATQLTSISFATFSALNSSTLPIPSVTAALYTGSPGSNLTLVPGSVNTVALNAPAFSLVTVPFATPQTVSAGQVFTAALLIDDVPVSVFPFIATTLGTNTNSYYDVSKPPGNFNTYDLASPNAPTLNGVTYPGTSNTNAGKNITLLRVNATAGATTTAATLTVTGGGSFSGTIQDGTGAVSLVKTGSSTQTLSGTNTYSGSTTVGAGTLLVTGTLGSGSVVINGGATLNDQVINTNNSGNGSLRQAILNANTASGPGSNLITFNIPGSGVDSINLQSQLPTVTSPVVIDATTQPGYSGTPLIELNGTSAGATATGLKITAGNSAIKGLDIVKFGGDGIDLLTNGGDTVQATYVGIDPTGTFALGNSGDGIFINSANNVIVSNVISGNTFVGIDVSGSGATGNVVQGNFVGTNAAATAKVSNGSYGVEVHNGAGSTTVGGTSTAARNVISGNTLVGVFLHGSSNNVVAGNFIGTNAAGSSILGNADNGIQIDAGSKNNVIGGTTAGSGNVISRNVNGVYIRGSGTTGNLVEGNFIGTDPISATALANTNDGVIIDTSASGNTIGGPSLGMGNVVSGNANDGIMLLSSGNIVQGNFIGTDSTGTTLVSNGSSGIDVQSANDTIGGSTAAARNLIAGTGYAGIRLTTAAAHNDWVAGNWIGLNGSGTVKLGNLAQDISLEAGASSNLIGTNGDGVNDAGERNVLAGGQFNVISVYNANTNFNVIAGNYIGTDTSGLIALGTGGSGIGFGFTGGGGPTGNRIGTNGTDADVAGEGNVIAGNGIGILITGAGSTSTTVAGNFIGTNAAGTGALANGTGIIISAGATNNTIGGTLAGMGNVISGNSGNGVTVTDAGTTGTVVAGNVIGLKADNSGKLANGGEGVLITSGAASTTVGGTTALSRNVISGNANRGVNVSGSTTTANVIEGNYIGTDTTGTATGFGNTNAGVLVTAPGTIIGGTVAGAGNVIAGNGLYGVRPNAGSSGSLVAGNFIGTNAAGTAALANGNHGVFINGGGNDTIGGTTAAARNVIAGNVQDGINIANGSGGGNFVEGNYIGTDSSGTTAVANGANGITISGSAGNTIGGTTAEARNVISGNGVFGVEVTGSGATGNLISGNYVGTNATATAAVGNGSVGIQIDNGASGNTVGGTSAGARNVVSGNLYTGVRMLNSANNNVVEGNYIGTDVTGTVAIGNHGSGVFLEFSSGNIVGGTSAAARNIISGNLVFSGVGFYGASATNNVVEGNYIGTDTSGMVALGNVGYGVQFFNSASNNTLSGNVIAASTSNGVQIQDSGTQGNVVAGNLIGTTAAGTISLSNGGDGVVIASGATGNTIGGTTTTARNVISGNSGNGVTITDSGTTGNVVAGNFIGIDAGGALPLGNSGSGVSITNAAANNTIGGLLVEATNYIGANGGGGISITSSGSGNAVLFNNVGVDHDGDVRSNTGFDVSVVGSGAITFGGLLTTGRSGVSIAASAIQWNANLLTTSAVVTLSGPVTLGAGQDGSLDTINTRWQGQGASVSFSSTIENATTTPMRLRVNGGSAGSVTLSGNVGSGANGPLGELTLVLVGDYPPSGTATFGGTVSAASVTVEGGANTAINGGSVTTSGDQTYYGPVTIGGSGATLNGANVTFASTVGGAALTVNSPGATTFNAAVTTASLTTDAGGTTALNGGAVTTTGNQTYNDSVTLGANTTLSAGTGNVSFASVVNGSQTLAVNSSGATTFNAAVGGQVALVSVMTDAAGTTAINGGAVTTTGDQVYNDSVTLGATTALTTMSGGNLAFNGTLDGSQNLTLTAGSGNISFAGAVGSQARLGTLTVVSATNVTETSGVYAASLAQQAGSGSTTLNGPVDTSAVGGVALTAQVIGVNGTINTTSGGTVTFTNGGQLTILAGANITGTGDVTQNGGGAVQTAGNITTAGNNVSFAALVTLTGPVSMNTSGGSVSFNNTLDGSQNLALTAGAGDVSFGAAVGSLNRLQTLLIVSARNVTAAAALKAVSLTQSAGTGLTTFNGPVDTSGAAGVAVTTNALTLNSTLNTSNGGPVTFTNAGLLSIAGGANITTTGAFTQNGTGSVLTGGNITTTGGNISFAANMTLTGPVTLNSNGGAVAFHGAVTGGPGTDLAVNAAGGPITFFSTIDGNFGGGFTLTATSAAVTAFDGTVGGFFPLAQLITGAAGSTDINASVTTTGNVTFNNPAYLTADVVVTDNGPATTSITFNSTLDSIDALNPHGLFVVSAGPKIFVGSIGAQFPLSYFISDATTPDLPTDTTYLYGSKVVSTGDLHFMNVVFLGNKVSLNPGGNLLFDDSVSGLPGTDTSLNLTGGENTKKIDGSKLNVAATFEITSTSTTTKGEVELIGGQKDNTFKKTADEHVDVKFVGGGPGSVNNFKVVPNSGVTLVSQGGDNTIDLSGALFPVETKNGTVAVGVTVNLAESNGQVQPVYQAQLSDPDIGSLVDPSVVLSSNTATLALHGAFQNVVLSSNAVLYTAPAGFDPTTGSALAGTTVVLMGSNNYVFAAPGTTVVGNLGNNFVNQNFSQTQANAFLVAGDTSYTTSAAGTTALANLFGTQTGLTSLFGSPATLGGLFGVPGTLTGLFGTPAGQNALTGLFGTTSGQSALAGLFGSPATLGGLFGVPGTLTGLFGTPAGSNALTGLFGTPAGQSALTALFGQPGVLSGLFGTPGALTNLFGTPAGSNALTGLFGTPAGQAALSGLFGQPGVLVGLFGTPGALTGLFGTPAGTAALTGLFGTPAGQNALIGLFGQPGALTTLFGTPGALTALFGTPAGQSALTGLFGTPAGAGALTGLFGTPGAITSLFGMPTALTSLFGTTTGASALAGLFGTPAGQAALTNLFGTPAGQSALVSLFGTPPSGAALTALFSDPATLLNLFGSPSNAGTLAGLFGTPDGAAALTALFGSPAGQAALTSLFGTPGALTGLFGTPGALTALFGTPAGQSALVGLFGTPAGQSALIGLFGTPGALTTLFGTPGALTGLFGTPAGQNALVGLFGSPAGQTALIGLFGQPGVLTTLFGVPGALTTLFGTPTGQNALVGLFGTPTGQAALVNLFGTPGVLTTLFGTPGVLTNLFGTPAGEAALAGLFGTPAGQNALIGLFGQPGVLTSLFGSPGTLTALFGSPQGQTALAGLFGTSQGTAALVGLFGTPSGAASLAAQLANSPQALEQVFITQPALLDIFIKSLSPQDQKQFFTAAALSLLRTYVNLSGSGNELSLGFLGSATIGANSLFTQNITPDNLAMINQALSDSISLSNYTLNVTATGGNNVFVGGVLGNFTANGGGNNRFIIADPSQLGVSSATTVPAAVYQFGSTFNGSGGSDAFYFLGSGADSIGNVTITEPATANTGTIDFSNYQFGGVNLNLGASGAQKVSQQLTLTLPNSYFANAIGGPGNDTITGNALNDTIQSAANDNPDPYALAGVPPSASIATDVAAAGNPDFPAYPNATQWVYLNFQQQTPVVATAAGLPSATATPESLHNGTGTYTANDQAAILAGLQNLFAPFNTGTNKLIQITLDPTKIPTGMPYETVYFNVTPLVNGQPSPGGQSNEIDFRNLSQNTSMVVDVNAFLGNALGLVPDNTSDWVNLSITVTAHELEHTLAARHQDAFGPIGYGISGPPGVNKFFPTYTGLTGAFTTQNHVIASPASVGSTLADAASGQIQIGEREAVKLSFINNGTVVDGTAGTAASGYTVGAAAAQATTVTLQHETAGVGNNQPPGTTTPVGVTTVNAQPVSLYTLNVPNTLVTGYDAGKTFDVDAVDVLGTLSGTKPDFYTFQGQAGDLMNFEVMSAALTRNGHPFDSVIYLYGPDGQLLTWNDDQFEPSDSALIDVTLPTSGTYTVEVDSFADATGQGGPNAGGDYELFMYRFLAYNGNGGNDTLVGGTGNTTFVVGSGNTTMTGGSGTNTVQQVGTGNVQLTGSQLTGLGTKTFVNIQKVSQFDNSYTAAYTFTIDPSFTGGVTLTSITGNDSVSVKGNLNASSVLFRGDLAAANITGNVLANSSFTVTGTLGSFTVGGSNGFNFNLSAAKITGSLSAPHGAVTGTIQTTGVETDANGLSSNVVADIGTVTGSGSNISVSTVVSSLGTFTGKLIAGGTGDYVGSIYSTVSTINGGFTGLISAAKDIGAVGHDSLGNKAWANGQVITAGGITVINGSDSGVIASGGSNYSDPTINGGMSGSVIAGGSILGPWTISGGFTGVFSAGDDLGAAQRDANNNIVVNSSTKQLVLYGSLTINGGDSGSITVGGDVYDAITINKGLNGTIGNTTASINGQTVNVGTATGGQIVVGGNLVGALTINNGMSGLIAVGGDVGAVQLTGNSTVALTNNSLTRYGGFTVNGGISGDVVVLGNVFCDFTVNNGLTGRVAVEGRQEYGLAGANGDTSGPFFGSDTTGASTYYARIGMLGKVTINGSIGSTGALVSGGVIGDDGLEYNPQTAQSSDNLGTLATVSGNSGILAATEDINGSSGVANTKGFFQDIAYNFGNKYASGANLAALDALFTYNKGLAVTFNTAYGAYSGLALLLGDLGSLYVNANGNLAGTVA